MKENIQSQTGKQKATRAICKSSKIVKNAIELALREYGESSARVIVGYSGGLDSTVLLHCLAINSASWQISLVAAHVNHGLRKASEDEAKWAEAFAGSYGVPFRRLDLVKPQQGVNIEAWARQCRYDFFASILDEEPGSLLATAHHLNDLAETLLFRVLSARAATDSRLITACSTSKRLLRPFLGLPRGVILQYAEEHGLEYLQDESNWDLRRTRNRIRHQMIPELFRNYTPSFGRSAYILSRKFEQDEDLLWQIANVEAKRGEQEKDKVRFLNQLHSGLAWRVLKLWTVQQVGETGWRLGYASLQSLLDRCRTGKDRIRSFELGFGIAMSVSPHGSCKWSITGNHGNPPQDDSLCRDNKDLILAQTCDLPIPGFSSLSLGGNCSAQIQVAIYEETPKEAVNESVIEFCSELVTDNNTGEIVGCYETFLRIPDVLDRLTVRNRQGGEKIWWKGCFRRLKTVLQSLRVPLRARQQLLIISIGEQIVWIPGLYSPGEKDISGTSKITNRLLHLKCRYGG